MTDAHIKELISKSFISAMAAHAGMTTAESTLDYGIDGTFKDIEYDPITHRYGETGFGIDFQLKATINAKPHAGIVKYNLEVKNYQQLIKTKVGCPRILIVYALPREREQWIELSSENAIFRKCAWWCSLKGLPTLPNKTTVLVEIPEAQQLTPVELIRLMDAVKGGAEF